MRSYLLILVIFGMGCSSKETCVLMNNTSYSVTNNGCPLLSRDTSSCQSSRTAQGLSGNWLKFSCRVNLVVSGANVVITSDGLPDYKSNYFNSDNACYTQYTPATSNSYKISSQNLIMTVPISPTGGGTNVMGSGAVGITLNGIPIFDNQPTSPDNIYNELSYSDQCYGHPNSQGNYHYNTEPYAISYNDYSLVGVMRDGYFIYGRNEDATGTLATSVGSWQTSYGGHVTTPPGGSSSLFHYHANLQTGANASGSSQSAYFLTGNRGVGVHPYYYGTAGACTGC